MALALRRPPCWPVTRKRAVSVVRPGEPPAKPIPLAAPMGAYLPDVLAGNGHEVRWGPSVLVAVDHGPEGVLGDQPSAVLPPRF